MHSTAKTNKIMKKLLLSLLFVLFSVIGFSQYQYQQPYVPNSESTPSINITINQIQNGWARIGNSCAGCPSYWFKITRTQQMHQAEDGQAYYYFYFHFYSNSFYTNGVQAGTYLSQVKFFHNGALLINTPYILVPAGQHVDGAWMRSQDPNASVTFSVSQMSVY